MVGRHSHDDVITARHDGAGVWPSIQHTSEAGTLDGVVKFAEYFAFAKHSFLYDAAHPRFRRSL